MADNTQLNTGTGGDLLSTDDIGGGVKVQRTKVQYGADGSATDVSSTTPLPVSQPLNWQAYGSARVTIEPTELFFDQLETLDANRWTTAGTAPTFANGQVTFASSTTAAATSQLISVPTFIQGASTWLQSAFAVKLDASGAAVTGAHRFFGHGTAPGTPATTSAATKLTDAWGFEVDTDGKMYAVVYAAGVRIFATDLSSTGTGVAQSKQPLDGAFHRYVMQSRSDRVYWFLDDINNYVATASFQTPNTQKLPLRIQQVNNATTQTAAPTLVMQSNAVTDTGRNAIKIADATYPWRQAKVYQQPSTGTGGLEIVGMSQPNTTGTITTSTSTVTTGDLSKANVISVFIRGAAHAGINVTFEASDDNTNWAPLQGVRNDTGEVQSVSGVITSNATRQWSFTFAGQVYFRVRATAYTSGTANVIIDPGTLALAPLVGAVVAGQPSSTSTVTNTAASASNVTLKAANTSRKALYIFNAGTSNLFVKLGATATATTSFTMMIPPNGFWELPDDPIYTGIVDGIWSATGGSGANVTELT